MPVVADGRLRHQPHRGDRAGVDHRVEGHAGRGPERDRVERVAGRLDADPRPDGGRAEAVEDRRVGERLGHRLDRERDPRVADLVDGAVDGRHDDAEPRRVGTRELRDVRGHGARRRRGDGARGRGAATRGRGSPTAGRAARSRVVREGGARAPARRRRRERVPPGPTHAPRAFLLPRRRAWEPDRRSQPMLGSAGARDK